MAHTLLTKEQQQILLQTAKDSIVYGLTYRKALPIKANNYSPQLQETRATFVTLQLEGRLRGCIGMLDAVQPLIVDVASNAFLAAFRDSRFSPISQAQLSKLEIHISILSPSEPIFFTSEEDLTRQLRPHIDGLILQEAGHRGTFLPAVWDSLPEPRQFLQQLKIKAGLTTDYWSTTLQVSRYTCDVIS